MCPDWLPPTGVYGFVVHAVYETGTSAPSNTYRCTIVHMQCACTTIVLPAPPPPVPPMVQIPPPGLPPLTTTPPPLPQQSAEGLNLLPVGEIPLLPIIPAIPASAGV